MTMLAKLIGLFLMSIMQIQALTVGSDTVPSREGLSSFSSIDNKMNGFGVFENGFTLQDASTTCSFDSTFPVSGSVTMNHGSLFLFKDLLFDENTNLASLGSIYGDNYCVDFARTITALTSGDGQTVIFDNVASFLCGDLELQMPMTIQGTCTIHGQGKKLNLNAAAQLTVAAGGTLTFNRVCITGLSGSKLSCAANNASVVFKNSTVCLDNDISFATGSLGFEQEVQLTGTNQFEYTSHMTSTIASKSKLSLGKEVSFRYAPSVANRDLLYMSDRSSKLYLDGCTIRTTTTGLRMTRGTVQIDNNTTFSCDGTDSSEAICFGNGTADGDVEVKWLSGATLTVYGGLYYDCVV